MGFIRFRIYTLKRKSLLVVAKDDYHTLLMRKSIRALNRNSKVSQYLHSKMEDYMNKIKAEGFLLLRYST